MANSKTDLNNGKAELNAQTDYCLSSSARHRMDAATASFDCFCNRDFDFHYNISGIRSS
jgi:hypothetical protein